MGRADIDIKFGANLDGLRTGMQKVQNEISAFQKQMTSVAGALGVAYGTQEILSFAKGAAELALQAEGIEKAFAKLSRPGLLGELQKATKGTVDNLTLMKSAVKANNFGLPLEQLATYFQFAQQRARETGESVDYLVESIVLGISRKSIPILDNLGFSSTKVQEAMAKTGDMAQAVGMIIQEEFGKAGDASDLLVDKVDKQKASLENLRLALGKKLTPAYSLLIDELQIAGSTMNAIFSDYLTGWEKWALAVGRAVGGMQGGALAAHLQTTALARETNAKSTYGGDTNVPGDVPVSHLIFPGMVDPKGKAVVAPKATSGITENLRGANETLVQMAQKSLPALTEGLQALNGIQGQTLPMFDENLLKIHETYAKLQGVSDMFMQGLQQSFEAALINGEEFFFVLGEWLSNFLKQMAAAVASALALAAVMSLIAPGVGTFGGNFMNLLGGSGGNVGNLVGVLRGDDIFLSNQRNGYGRSRTGN
jgi:hypothetical protein